MGTNFDDEFRRKMESSPIFEHLKMVSGNHPLMREYLLLVARYFGILISSDHDERPWASLSRDLNVKRNVDALYEMALDRSQQSLTGAAKLLGVNVKTVYNWRRRDGHGQEKNSQEG